jgi:phenylalanyl-tRNA synthetase beta chain
VKISIPVLRRFTDLPETELAVRDLLDDVGVEVKRADGAGGLTVELLANRGDHYAYDGIAREVAARTGGPVHMPEHAPLEVGESPVGLVLETEHCLLYTATLLERTGDAGSLPADVLAPLEGAGIHSLTAPVDATNLSNIEIGQPTHVFDADKIDGEIVIRLSVAGEKAWPLFQEGHVDVPEGTLVIADRSKILAIAGVIGCEDSKTTAESTRIVLESACFDPVKVRIASRALGIHTDSTARFERGSDPARPLVGAGRVVHLLEQHTGWTRVGTTGSVGDWVDPARTVACDPAAASTYLGVSLDLERVSALLGRQGFTPAGTDDQGRPVFRVPPWRLWDVEFTADLYEELAKAIGYNDTPITLPLVGRGALPSTAEVRKGQVEEVLLGAGFYEVFTDGFHGRGVPELLGIPAEGHPLSRHVETLNALDRDYSLLKNNALGQAVLAVSQNLRNKTGDVKLYEWTRTFHPVEGTDRQATLDKTTPPCTERAILWAVASGSDRPGAWADRSRPADVFFLKGMLDEIATTLGIDLQIGPPDADQPLALALHPGRQATVRQGDRVVGILGEVHPAVLKRAKIKRARPCYVEIEVAALQAPSAAAAYADPSAAHPLSRSLAFSLPPRFPAARVVETLRSAGPASLETVRITDRFDHEADGVPMRAITFDLTFDNTDQALTADAVNETLRALQEAVVAAHGQTGVSIR